MTGSFVAFEAGCPSGLAPANNMKDRNNFDVFARKVGNETRLDLSVRGAKCGGCLTRIETAVSALPGVTRARLNLSTGHLSAAWRGDLSADRIVETVSDLGYGVSAKHIGGDELDGQSEERNLLIAMGVAAFAAANIMLLSISVWAGHSEMGEMTRRSLHAVSGLIALPVIVFSGRSFFLSAFQALRHRNVNMDVPISLAVSLAFAVSVWETVTGGPHAYFDACVMLLFFLLIGRFLDARLRRRAYAAAHDLAALQNHAVTRIDNDGTLRSVRADQIAAGDTVLLAPGERALVDMVVSSPLGEIDESLVSGESLPRAVSKGARLFAGSVNLGPALKGTSLAAAADSLLSDIASMLEAGEQRRSRYRKIADKAVGLYVPLVHATAALAFLGWLALGATVRESILIAVSTLIITCPCALALAAPVVQVVASGRLFRQGVFLKSGDALERLATVDHVVFDKTGTLTLGTLQLLGAQDRSIADLEAAAQLARISRHPLSRAIVAAAGPGPIAENVQETAGQGLKAVIDGQTWCLGSAKWIGLSDAPDGDGPHLWFQRGDDAPILFRFAERLRQDAAQTVAALQANGISLEILSGDQPKAVAKMATALNISDWRAGASPAEKVARLEALRAKGKRVLMVGDGLNDAGALSLAHASLAPGGAMDVSQSSSDAVFAGGLAAIPIILQTSKQARHVMLQNFGLAALYNAIAVPIAVTGHVTPLIAAIAMSASSLIVTANALRLGLGQRGAAA